MLELVSFTNPLASVLKSGILSSEANPEKNTHCSSQDGHIIGIGGALISRKCLRKKMFVHNFCHNRRQTILHQFDHSPPPIWSLDSTGFHWICLISFHISHHICSKWQCSEPRYHVLQRIWFRFQHTLLPGSEWGEFGDLQIKFCACITWQCHLCRHNIHCTPQLIVYLDFLWNITAVVSEYCRYWK